MKRILQITAIAALTVFFLALFLHDANLEDVGRILRSMNPLWFAIALLTNFSALLFRTARWRTLLAPEDPPPFYPTFFATAVGYMISTILPIRASDVARPALLSRRTNHRFSGAFGTVLTERMLDLCSILLLFIYFSAVHWDDFSHDPESGKWFYIVKAGALAAVVLLILLTGFVLGLFFFRPRIRRFHEMLGRFVPRRFRDSWMHFFDTFTGSLEIVRHRGALIKIVLCTAGIWFCLTTQFTFTVLALHRPLPWDSSIFVTGITTLGLAIPTPGGVGGFHKACQLVLTRFYGFDIDSSVAVAILFHIVGTLPVIVTGLLLLAHEGLHWRDVKPS